MVESRSPFSPSTASVPGFLASRFLRRRPRPRIDIGPERRVLNRATFGPTPDELTRIQTMGWRAWLDEQLAPGQIDDQANELYFQSLTDTSNDTTRLQRGFLQRCVASKAQLQMKMASFWERHFNTNRRSSGGTDNEIFEHERFRKLALGRLEDLLIASATSPAMIFYLDNQSNRAGAPNENYAREVLELHTLGVNGPYTEPDISELARVFTGWRAGNSSQTSGYFQPRSFFFHVSRHDTGPKTVMGWATPGKVGEDGLQEGMQFLRYLARHPATIDFIARKLCRSFLSADPSEAEVAPVRAALSRDAATIADAMRVIFETIAGSKLYARSRSQSNLEYMIGLHRRLGFERPNVASIRNVMNNLGSPLFEFAAPTGPPDAGPAFETPGTQIVRWNFVHDLLRGSVSQSVPDFATLLGTPAPATPRDLVQHLADIALDGDIDTKSESAILDWAEGRVGLTPSQVQLDGLAPEILSLMFRLPAAQVN